MVLFIAVVVFLCGRNHRNYDYNIFVKWDDVGTEARYMGVEVYYGDVYVCVFIYI